MIKENPENFQHWSKSKKVTNREKMTINLIFF